MTSTNLKITFGDFGTTTVVIAANDEIGRAFLRGMSGSKIAPVSVEIRKSFFQEFARIATEHRVTFAE